MLAYQSIWTLCEILFLWNYFLCPSNNDKIFIDCKVNKKYTQYFRGLGDNDLYLLSAVCIYIASKIIDIYAIGMEIIYKDVYFYFYLSKIVHE
jgi:hypothetical protein